VLNASERALLQVESWKQLCMLLSAPPACFQIVAVVTLLTPVRMDTVAERAA